MKKLKGYEDLAHPKIKELILTEFYNTGRVNGIYMKKYSNSKENPLKYYIIGWLKLNGIFLTQDQYIDDIYQLLFIELFKIDADKFVDVFFNNKGELNINKLCATACLMIKRKAFYRLVREDNKRPDSSYVWDDVKGYEENRNKLLVVNHSYITKVQHGSIYGHGVININPIEKFNEDGIDEGDGIIIYDKNDDDAFFDKYNFVPSDILDQLTPDERDLFLRNTGKSFNPKNSTQIMLDLANKIKDIKTKLDDRKRTL